MTEEQKVVEPVEGGTDFVRYHDSDESDDETAIDAEDPAALAAAATEALEAAMAQTADADVPAELHALAGAVSDTLEAASGADDPPEPPASKPPRRRSRQAPKAVRQPKPCVVAPEDDVGISADEIGLVAGGLGRLRVAVLDSDEEAEPFVVGPVQDDDTVIESWEERDAWDFVPITLRGVPARPLLEGEPLALDVDIKTTRASIEIHQPRIDLILTPIGRICCCASQPCGCPRTKDQRLLTRGVVTEVGSNRTKTRFRADFDLKLSRTYLDHQVTDEGLRGVAFDAYLRIRSSFEAYEPPRGVGAGPRADGTFEYTLDEEIAIMDKVLWRCNNVPRPPDRVVELGAELHVERPLTVAVAPLAPGGGEFHVALTNDHATLPLRLCTCDLGNPRFVHVKGRKMPADLAPGDRWDFDVEVVDTANFTDAYIELTFCWRCGDEAAGGPDVGRAPGTWAHFVAQEVIMWTSTKPKRPTPDDPQDAELLEIRRRPRPRRRRRRSPEEAAAAPPPPPFPEEDAPAFAPEEAAPDDAACAICDDAAGGARTPCCGTAICAACVARAAASANAAFKCAFCLDASPAFYAFERSVGARVDLEALPAWDADAGDDLCPALPACAASCCACPHGPAFDAATARATRSTSAAVWNLLACESCGVSYAHAGCLAKRRRGGFVCGLCESGDDDDAARRPSRENPKKAGSKSALRYDAYKSASTVREFLELGGTRADLRHDIALGYVVVVDRAPTPPPRAQRATALPSFVKSCPAYLGRAAAAVALRHAAPGIPNGDPAPGWHKEIIPRKHDPREADVHFYDARSGRQFRSLASLRAFVAPGDLDAFDFRHAAGRARCPPVPARSEINGALREIWGGLSKREQAAARAAAPGRDVPPHPTATVRAAEAAVDRTGGTAEQRAFASLMAAVYSHNKTY
ncbi:hypothetical protein JL722_9781 [Aureococcus anophagefferens]|nr:hypothetical protein JL722_9781 [Aureococcus anophagefferens]